MATPYNSTDLKNSRTSSASKSPSSARTGDQVASSYRAQDTDVEASKVSASTPIQQDVQAQGFDSLKGSLMTAVEQAVRQIEPQLNDYANQLAHQAIDRGADYGRVALQRVQRQSWGRIGFAAALFAGAVALLAYESSSSSDSSLH